MRQALAFLSLLCLTSCVHAQTQGLAGSGGAGGLSGFQTTTLSPFKITTGSCPSGTLNQSGYTCQVTASGGIGPYSCSLNSGTIPPGLQLVGCSVIGTPTTPAGTNAFVITVTDSASTPNTANVSLSITVGCPSLSILSPPQIPAGQQGTAYGPFQFQANGGILPLTWSQNGGNLCSGLTLDGGGLGQLSGTPTIQQTCNFGMTVADTCNLGTQTAGGQFTQQINTNIAVTTTSLPNATAGVFYQQTLSNSGGTGPYTWSIQSGSLPGTLTLSTGGTISGTVNVDGLYSFTVQVTDSLNASATQALTLTVASAPLNFLSTSPLPSCTQGQTYPPFQMQANGGFGTLSYSAPGLASVGLAISSGGLITGSCTQVGVFNPTITVTDQSQPTVQSLSQTFQITMKQNIGPLTVNDPSLPNATAGSPYSAGITLSGGVAPYVFVTSPISGHFPAGLTLSTSGTVSGTATVAEADTPAVQISDSETPPQTITPTISITSVCPAITSTNGGAMPPAKQGTAYSFQVTASGGYSTLSYSIAGQPSGLSINTSTGLISGTPSASGAFPNIVVTVTDSCSPTPQTFAINLTLQVNTNLGITTTSPLHPGQVGVAYSLTFHGAGGTPPYTWTSGTLPGGLTLTSAGLLSGTPTTAGTTTVAVTLTDSVPNTITANFTITINPATQTTPALPDPTLLNWNTNISNTPSPGTVRCVGSPGVACGASYATIALALAAAACGDVIVLQNTQFVITGTLTFSLQCNASNWLTVERDTSDATFPAELSNVTPCYAGLSPTTLVGLPNYTCNTPARHMPQIEKSGNGATINVICSYCRFIGIEWTRDNTYDIDFGILNMAITTCTNPDLTCMNSMPTNIIFDRNIVHGDAQRQTVRAVSFSGTRWDAFINSYCYDVGVTNAGGAGDAQCLQSGTGHNFTNVGFQKVINDFISASTMPQLTGGGFTEPISPITGFDGVPHDIWNAYWWAYTNPLWNTQIGQSKKAAEVIEGVSYPPANDQELTVQPTALQLAVNTSFQFQTVILNDSRAGINRTAAAVPTLACGTAGGCGTITTNTEHTVGTGIFASANQVTYTYNAPAAIPSGNTVTITFPFATVDNRAGTIGNSRNLCNPPTASCQAVVTIVNSNPTHLVAVGPSAPDLQMQPSYSDARFNVRQFNLEFNAIANFATTFSWTVDGVANGNSTVGTIQTQSSLALYTAPTTTGSHTICAVASDSTQGCSTVKVSLTAPIVAFDFKAFTHKNGYELKECSRCLFENSLLANSWGSSGNGGGQGGNTILLQPANQASQVLDGSGNNVGYGPEFNSDITIRYIKAEHMGFGIVAVPLGGAKGMHRVSFANVLVDDMDYTRWGNGFIRPTEDIQTLGTASTTVLGWESASNPPADNISFRHLTMVGIQTNAFGGANNLAQFPLINHVYQDSILASPNSSTFVNPNGDANDCNTASGAGPNNTETNFFSKCVSPYTFNHLALVGSTALASVFVSPHITEPSVATVNFINYNGANGGDYRLCKTSLGCSANSIYSAGQTEQASDGTDLGADVTGINTVEATIRGSNGVNHFYVATTGNDSNTVTQAQNPATPWLTINHASTAATLGAFGTVIHVAAGTYNQCPFTTRSGGPNQRLVYQSDVLLGAKIVCTGGTNSGTEWFNGGTSTTHVGNYIDIVGFDISTLGNDTTICTGISIYGDGDRVLKNYVHDIPDHKVNCGSAPDGNNNGGAGIAAPNCCNSVAGDAQNQVVDSNTVDNIGFDTPCNTIHGIYISTPRATVTNNIVSRACGWQIVTFHQATQDVISNNTVFNGNDGILVNGDGTITNNNNTTVDNNIVLNMSGGSANIVRNGVNTGTSNFFGNNMFFGDSGGTVTCVNGVNSCTVVGSITLTSGQNSGLFVNYTGTAAGNYHLQSGSAAIGAGIINCATGGIVPCIPGRDFDGNTTQSPPYDGVFQVHQ